MLNQGVWRDVIRTVQMIPAPSKNYMQVIQTLLFCKAVFSKTAVGRRIQRQLFHLRRLLSLG